MKLTDVSSINQLKIIITICYFKEHSNNYFPFHWKSLKKSHFGVQIHFTHRKVLHASKMRTFDLVWAYVSKLSDEMVKCMWVAHLNGGEKLSVNLSYAKFSLPKQLSLILTISYHQKWCGTLCNVNNTFKFVMSHHMISK